MPEHETEERSFHISYVEIPPKIAARCVWLKELTKAVSESFGMARRSHIAFVRKCMLSNIHFSYLKPGSV